VILFLTREARILNFENFFLYNYLVGVPAAFSSETLRTYFLILVSNKLEIDVPISLENAAGECSIVVIHDLPKVESWVRFPSLAQSFFLFNFLENKKGISGLASLDKSTEHSFGS
jgi:hypothetical protein